MVSRNALGSVILLWRLKAYMPFHLFIYNDLPHLRRLGSSDDHDALMGQLIEQLRREPRVSIIDVNEQLDRLSRIPLCVPFGATIAVGAAGERIARLLNQQTGRFPTIRTIPVNRVETAAGRCQLSPESIAFLDHELHGLVDTPLSIVDDTIYSGLTLLEVVRRLPASILLSTQVFCLQAIAESLPPLRAICTVHAGLELAGQIGEEVSIIKTSNLFMPGAIRHLGGGELAFYQRVEWMKQWFILDARGIIALCARLAPLESGGSP